jgi:branched-chain amino acid aminotransferase
MSYILNGKFIEEENIHLDIRKNGSFWYGDGFFEALKWTDEKILYAQLHWERIMESCNTLKMENPFLSLDELSHFVEILAKQYPDKPLRIKIIIWRSSFQAYSPTNDSPEYLIIADPISEYYYPLNTSGLNLSIYTDHLKSTSALGNIKTTSSQLYVLATHYTQTLKKDDSIILNTNRNIIETSRSNFWLVKDGCLYTPPLTEGCLNGIMRKVVMMIYTKLNLTLIETAITLEMLNQANEVFTTSAIRGIQWVEYVDEIKFSNPLITKELSELINSNAASY